MKKLRLDVEALDVASFETADSPEARGTVEAHSSPLVTPWAVSLATWFLN